KKIQSKRGVLSGKSRRIGSLEDTRPWDDLGISRRKYFYMKKNGEGK
ncbi:replicase, partial [Shigella sonnei]|nr:replicase [Shigella sonnei]EAA5012865.1 replicase [Shigella sonnei]EGD7371888.1 replicase [Shigella sonnei]EGD8051024.1 replicase [Shigella sonnei]EGD8521603.1 replicase [Shigella sonnei]